MEIKSKDWTLKKLRLYKEYSQKFIAEKLEITQAAYGKKELGNRKFDLDEFKILCDLFNIPMETMYLIIKNK